ncbi:MAG: hypothetical protein KDD47_05975, partial [Acidobacteria bacterium]|nr:hypothetical protein [Acidobacteriota bacterium]
MTRRGRARIYESRTVVSFFDVAGNKVLETDPRGFTTLLVHDRLDRLVRQVDPAPFLFEQSFTYDLAGNRLTAEDRRGHTSSFAYDGLNRLVLETSPAPFSFSSSRTYDAAG